MEHGFWRGRWQEGRIGFHQDDVHPRLVGLGDFLRRARRIVVPLSGKSKDLHWLRTDSQQDPEREVVAVELVEEAVIAFHDEAQLQPTVEIHGDHKIYRVPGLTTVVGDFFGAVDSGLLPKQGFDGWYDRAAIIALPENLRQRYASAMCEIVAPGGMGLLFTLDYDQIQMQGPPFSVPKRQVADYFGESFSIAPLEEYSVLEHQPRFKARGVTDLAELAFKLERQ